MSIVLTAIALLIGVSLGLIGAGGAIVAVPAFVYLGGIDPYLADGYALFVVAVSSAVAVAMQTRVNMIDWKTIAWFGPSTILSLIVVRGFLEHLVPQSVQMLLFGLILLLASAAMLRKKPQKHGEQRNQPVLLSMFGIVVGAVGGLLGVGGGFLMTPALNLWVGLDMKRAVASSLVLIAVNSAAGVAVDLIKHKPYDWAFLAMFTMLTIAGIVAGTILSRRVDGNFLRSIFGWVVLAIGLFVLGNVLHVF
ncbi:MAG: sulfite exporter TauE/SafE family protein [Ignavibacteria bacterium]|nr:sulfite exporter TauE/SafE family protein [Ignavibacteria bacterium]